MKCFLSERHCKAFLNKESLYYRANIRAGVLQCSILGSIFFFFGNSFYLDYGYIVYDQPNNETFYQRLQSFKYSTAVGSARAFRGIYFECLIVPRGNYFFDFSPPRTFLFQPPRLLIWGGGGGVSNLDKLFETIYLCWLFCDLAKEATRL